MDPPWIDGPWWIEDQMREQDLMRSHPANIPKEPRMLSETIKAVENACYHASRNRCAVSMTTEECSALLTAAKLSEARARACELAKALIANTQGMSEGECGFWEHIEPLKTALADAEKGSA